MTRLLFSLAFLLVSNAAFAADEDKDTIVDPEKAGIEYEMQGEYVGEVAAGDTKLRIGLQVIALGDGEFATVAYIGGLPGDGWDGENKHAGTGKLDGETVTIESGDGQARGVIKDGVCEVFTADGVRVAEMPKVHRKSPTLGAKPPKDALVLFDGESAEHFKDGKVVMDNLLAANTESKEKLGSHTLHLEFRTPFKPKARGQARGNSGVYIQGRYELQVLDSFGLEGENNECGGIYSIAKPAVNAAFPPLTWQTYDIEFTEAEWNDAGEKTKNARATIHHNGILIHDDLELPHGTPGKYPEEPGPGPLYLQGHGNPVVYRNIWVVKN